MSKDIIDNIDEIRPILDKVKAFRGDWLLWQIIEDKRVNYRCYICEISWDQNIIVFKNCERRSFKFMEGIDINFFQRERRIIYRSDFIDVGSRKISTKVPAEMKFLLADSTEEAALEKTRELHEFTQKVFIKDLMVDSDGKLLESLDKITISGQDHNIGEETKHFMKSFYGDLEDLDEIIKVTHQNENLPADNAGQEMRSSVRFIPKIGGKKVSANIYDGENLLSSGYYELIDISRGGLCLKSENESEFNQDNIVELVISGQLPIKGKVVNKYSSKNDQSIRVGILFLQK